MRAAALAAVAAVALAACDSPAAPTDRQLVVFAAASLTEAFPDVVEAFEEANAGVTVVTSFAGSSSLREQILAGAPAGVFASADTSTMDQVVAAGAALEATVFAGNRLQIAVPAGNPAGVGGIADFADPDLLLGLCAPEVPCGNFARQALDAAGVTPSVDTQEPDVRALLTKVQAGELDAGIVYRTDVAGASGVVEGLDIPEATAVIATYPIAILSAAPDPTVARAFVDFVLSDVGQAILDGHGFGPPPLTAEAR